MKPLRLVTSRMRWLAIQFEQLVRESVMDAGIAEAQSGSVQEPITFAQAQRTASESRAAKHAQAQTIPNFAIFGRPIREGSVAVHCINRLILNQAEYDLVFGPVGYSA